MPSVRRRRAAEATQAGGIGFARQRPVAADDLEEQRPDAEAFEHPLGRPAWLVGQHGQRQQRIEPLEGLADAGVQPRGVEQSGVVEGEEAVERAGRVGIEGRGAEHAPHQHRGAVADQADDLGTGQWPAAKFDRQGAGRRRQVGGRVHQGAVEIEYDRAGRPGHTHD